MAPAAIQPTPAPGEFRPHLFGKFFLLQRLAVGGMAELYRARVQGAAGFEKELVVKRILPARAQDEGFIKMLVNEAKLTVQLTHSNVAQVYECGDIVGNYFISMELVHGVSLKEMMAAFARAGAQLSPEQAIFLVLQLLTGLDYAHRRTDHAGRPLRVVHCDVSPDNALVSWEGEVKLLDFGIARAATNLSNYKEGMLMGKLGYVAPEQASVERRWDHRVDLFAAGIILYELLTKQKPFPRATDVESLVASRKARVVPPTAIDPRLPKDIDAVVRKALAYDPDDRYADARSFGDALVDVLFPTPHSAIQDLLGRQMKTVFAEKIVRESAARANDPAVMKELSSAAHVAARLAPVPTPTPSPLPVPVSTTPSTPASAAPAPARGRTPDAAPRPRRGIRFRAALGMSLVLAAASALAVHAAQPWLRDGVVVVTSEPPGAEVSLDGTPTGLRTPVVLEQVRLADAHEVTLSGDRLRSVSIPLPPTPGRLVARAHAQLATAVGEIRVESVPPGADVTIDDRPAGRTPVAIPDVRLDARHRIDLLLPEHQPDQFVVVPERDGLRFSRTLARSASPPPDAGAATR